MLLAAALAAILSTGCPDMGAILWTFGMVPDQEVKAEFTMPEGPLLILVDDEMGMVQPTLARDALVDALAIEFRRHEVVERVTTNEEIARIRQSSPDFDQLSIREVGKRAKADTVLWMNVERFSVQPDLEKMVSPGHFMVRLKVFDARAEKTRDVRLWPPTRDGKYVKVEVGPHDMRECSSMAEVHRLMAARLAEEIAKLFYDYKIKAE